MEFAPREAADLFPLMGRGTGPRSRVPRRRRCSAVATATDTAVIYAVEFTQQQMSDASLRCCRRMQPQPAAGDLASSTLVVLVGRQIDRYSYTLLVAGNCSSTGTIDRTTAVATAT